MENREEPAYALRLKQVVKRFGGVTALDHVDFDVKAGEVHCLAGENGCGKSTLIKIVTGVYQPEEVELFELFGEKFSTISPVKARQQGVSVIWQDLALFPHMSVAENIVFEEIVGLKPSPVRFKKLRADAENILERLDVDLDLDALLHELPIAQRQIVAIARALLKDARLIFMDEPTASLTNSETDRLLEIVRKLQSEGVAIVFVSHRLAEVLEISERVTVVRDGHLIGVYPTEGMTQARLGELMTGHEITSKVVAEDHSHDPVVLDLEGLSCKGKFEDVSFKIHQGEVVGITGLIGAGRTELAHTLIGFAPQTSGRIRLLGKGFKPKNIREAIRQGLAYVPEDRLSLGLIQDQAIEDNTVIAILKKLLTPLGLISPPKKEQTVSHWVKQLGIKIGLPSDWVMTLSGGNQQKVVLSKWLATKPKLLILDSPTVGVDVGAREGIFNIVRDLAAQGLSILLISDEIPEVLNNSDRVMHMKDGRIVGEYDPRQISIPEMEAIIYA